MQSHFWIMILLNLSMDNDSRAQSEPLSPSWMIHKQSIHAYRMPSRRAPLKKSQNVGVRHPAGMSFFHWFAVSTVIRGMFRLLQRWLNVTYRCWLILGMSLLSTILTFPSIVPISSILVGYQDLSLWRSMQRTWRDWQSFSHWPMTANVSFEAVLFDVTRAWWKTFESIEVLESHAASFVGNPDFMLGRMGGTYQKGSLSAWQGSNDTKGSVFASVIQVGLV